MYRQFDKVMALSAGLSLGSGERAVPAAPVRLQYSALSGSETPLPHDLRPTSLLQNATGSIVVGDLLLDRRDDVARTVAGSLAFVHAIARALPTDAEDERIVDALVAEKTAGLPRRSLRRRPGQ